MAATNRYKDLLDYTIAYKTVWTVMGVVFALGVAGLIAWHELKPPSEAERARQEVKSAERLLQRAEGCARGDLAAGAQQMLADGRAALQSAQESLAAKTLGRAMASAHDAQDYLKQFVDEACMARDVVAEFRRIQGDVKVKKVNSPRWVQARKGPLAVGDRISATSGVAEVFYPASGEVQTLRPGTIIEIKNVVRKPDGQAGTETRLEEGEMSMESSPNSISIIVAPHVTVEPAGDLVEVISPEGATDTGVRSIRGGATVKTSSGTTTLVRSTQVRANLSGKISEPTPVLDPPEPKEPIDNRIFSTETPQQYAVLFKWLPVEGAGGYRFQLSTNDLFVPVLNPIDAQRTAGTAIEVTFPKANTYHWRVAAIDRSGVDGRWSEVRRFSIRGGKVSGGPPPPEIEIVNQVKFADRVIVSGKTAQYVTLECILNGHKYQDVSVDDKGEFQVLVTLSQEGMNTIEFVAQDTYGQESRKSISARFSVD